MLKSKSEPITKSRFVWVFYLTLKYLSAVSGLFLAFPLTRNCVVYVGMR